VWNPTLPEGEGNLLPEMQQTCGNNPINRARSTVHAENALEDSEQILLSKIRELNQAMKVETNPDKLIAYGNALSSWLGAIEKLRRVRNQTLAS
jgi:hypothetical protein